MSYLSRHLAGSLLLVAVLCLGSLVLYAEEPGPAKPELVPQTGHTNWVFSVAFSPDGKLLATGGDQKTILWSVADMRQLQTLTGHRHSVSSVAFTRDGRLLATGSDSIIILWGVKDRRKVFEITGDDLDSLAFSPDGRLLAIGDRSGIIRVLNIAERRLILEIDGHNDSVNELAFSPDGRLLATCSFDKTVKLWTVADGKEVRTLAGHTYSVNSLSFSPDGKLLATGSGDKTVKLWRVADGRELATLHGTSPVVFSPDGKLLASGSTSKSIKIWRMTDGQTVRTLVGHSDDVGSLAFSPDGRLLASGSRDHSVKIWSVPDGREIGTGAGHLEPVSCVSFSPDGRSLAFGGYKNTVKLWNMADGRKVSQLAGQTNFVNSLTFHPGGKLLAAASYDTVKIWSVGDGQVLRTLKGAGLSALHSLAFTPDGRLLITGDDNNGVAMRSVKDGSEVSTLAGHIVQKKVTLTFQGGTEPAGDDERALTLPNAFAIRPDGRLLATTHNRIIKLWNVDGMQPIRTLTGHSAAVNAIVFSPNGKMIATGGFDRTVRLWNVEDGRELYRLARHTAPVFALAFSPDGKLLASGSEDNSVRLWNVASGKEVGSFLGHTGRVAALAFSPDGKLLASGGDDGTVRLWDPLSRRGLVVMCALSSDKDWLVMTPEGLFDGTDAGIQYLVAWRMGNRVYPPERFLKSYYTPGLLAEIYAGKRPKPDVDIAALKLPPDVLITSPGPVSTAETRRIQLTAECTDQGGGVKEVRLYHNGRLVSAQEGKAGYKTSYSFQRNMIDGENVLGVKALSKEQTESNLCEVRVVYKAPEVPKSSLHLLLVGINRYTDPRNNLQFARGDVESVLQFFQKRGSRLFASVNPIILRDEKATRKGIMDALDSLAQATKPEDVLIIYLAGHGVVVDEQFYFLSHDMKEEQDEEAAYRKFGVSAIAIGDALYRAGALKQVLIMDTCHSEAALPALRKLTFLKTRGATEDKALKMLGRSRGIYLIAASTQIQRAHEVKQLGHGVLTYVLLNGLGEKGPPKAEVNGMVTVGSLTTYVNQQVPELTEQYLKGKKQYPVTTTTGMDFPLAVR